MIDGITVLYQEEIMKNVTWANRAILILAIIAMISFFIAVLAKDMYSDVLFLIGIVGLFISLFGAILISIIAPQEPTGKYEYKVIIDDTVSMTEFYEKYEVIDQEGEIWTIRDK